MGEMTHVTDDDLRFYLRGCVDNVEEVEAHIKACTTCRSRLGNTTRFIREVAALNASHDGPDKRSEPRIPTDEIGSIRILNPFLGDREQVRILDVSKNGMKVRVPVPVALGSI